MAKNYYIELGQSIPAIIYATECPEGYSLIENADLLLELTEKDYVQKEIDGNNFYNRFRSRLLLQYKSAQISLTDAVTIENYLKIVAENLCKGNWLTAQYLCSNIAISGIFTQSLKDEILNGITDYITANY